MATARWAGASRRVPGPQRSVGSGFGSGRELTSAGRGLFDPALRGAPTSPAGARRLRDRRLHLRRRPDGDHRAALHRGAVRAGRPRHGRLRRADAGAPFYRLLWTRRRHASTTAATPSTCSRRSRARSPPTSTATRASSSYAARSSSRATASSPPRRSCASPTWCGSRRSSRGCAPTAPCTRTVSRFVKDEHAAPGAVVPLAAGRRQPVRDQRRSTR